VGVHDGDRWRQDELPTYDLRAAATDANPDPRGSAQAAGPGEPMRQIGRYPVTQPLTEQQIAEKLQTLNGWKRNDLEGQPGIMKVFATGDFLSGLAFVTRVAVLAEKANHHPDVVLTYPKVSVRLTTHDAAGLTAKDFELAGQIDTLKP